MYDTIAPDLGTLYIHSYKRVNIMYSWKDELLAKYVHISTFLMFEKGTNGAV